MRARKLVGLAFAAYLGAGVTIGAALAWFCNELGKAEAAVDALDEEVRDLRFPI